MIASIDGINKKNVVKYVDLKKAITRSFLWILGGLYEHLQVSESIGISCTEVICDVVKICDRLMPLYYSG